MNREKAFNLSIRETSSKLSFEYVPLPQGHATFLHQKKTETLTMNREIVINLSIHLSLFESSHFNICYCLQGSSTCKSRKSYMYQSVNPSYAVSKLSFEYCYYSKSVARVNRERAFNLSIPELSSTFSF